MCASTVSPLSAAVSLRPGTHDGLQVPIDEAQPLGIAERHREGAALEAPGPGSGYREEGSCSIELRGVEQELASLRVSVESLQHSLSLQNSSPQRCFI